MLTTRCCHSSLSSFNLNDLYVSIVDRVFLRTANDMHAIKVAAEKAEKDLVKINATLEWSRS